MGDLFVVLGIACMVLWLWGQLSATQQDSIRETTKSVRDTAKEQIHKVTK
jgi:hypothetical protein